MVVQFSQENKAKKMMFSLSVEDILVSTINFNMLLNMVVGGPLYYRLALTFSGHITVFIAGANKNI